MAWTRPAKVASALIQVKQLPMRSLFSETLGAWASEQSSRVALTLESESFFRAASYAAGLAAAVKTRSAWLMMLRFSAKDRRSAQIARKTASPTQNGHRVVQTPKTAFAGDRTMEAESQTAATGCGFNRSMQQLDEVVQPVYRSLVSCVGVR